MYHEKLCCLIVFASGISSVQQETGMGTKQWDILIDTTFTAECQIITYARGDLEPLVLGKSWACKHWKIQNNYFVISLSFFCHFFWIRFVVLNLCWHFLCIFGSFFGHFFVIFLSFVCHVFVIWFVICWSFLGFLCDKLHVMFSYRFCLLVKGQLVLLCCHLLQRI